MEGNITFDLTKDQAEFLGKKYSDIPLVNKILATRNGLRFTATEDDMIDFYDWLIDESINTMTADYDATEDTYMLESISDWIADT